MSPYSKYFLPVLLGFLGVGALGGGGILLISPSGKLMGMPLSMLDHSPFSSFLVPAIILFLVLGVAPLVLIVALWNKPASKFAEQLNYITDMHWSWTFSIYLAFALIIWIQMQLVFLQAVHWLHTVYMFYAIVMIICALLPGVRKLYKRND